MIGIDSYDSTAWLVLTVGSIVVLATMIRTCFQRHQVPVLVNFILLGLFLRLADRKFFTYRKPDDTAKCKH